MIDCFFLYEQKIKPQIYISSKNRFKYLLFLKMFIKFDPLI